MITKIPNILVDMINIDTLLLHAINQRIALQTATALNKTNRSAQYLPDQQVSGLGAPTKAATARNKTNRSVQQVSGLGAPTKAATARNKTNRSAQQVSGLGPPTKAAGFLTLIPIPLSILSIIEENRIWVVITMIFLAHVTSLCSQLRMLGTMIKILSRNDLGVVIIQIKAINRMVIQGKILNYLKHLNRH